MEVDEDAGYVLSRVESSRRASEHGAAAKPGLEEEVDGENNAFDDDETIPNPHCNSDGTTDSDNRDLAVHGDAVDRLLVSYCNHSSRFLLTLLTRTTQMLTPKLGLRHLSLDINNTWVSPAKRSI